MVGILDHGTIMGSSPKNITRGIPAFSENGVVLSGYCEITYFQSTSRKFGLHCLAVATYFFWTEVLILSLSLIIGARGSAVPYFFTSLPLWIVAAGNLACTLAWKPQTGCHVENAVLTLKAAGQNRPLVWTAKFRCVGTKRSCCTHTQLLKVSGYSKLEFLTYTLSAFAIPAWREQSDHGPQGRPSHTVGLVSHLQWALGRGHCRGARRSSR